MKLLSIEFLGIALVAVLALPLARGALRWTLFLALNALFAASYLEPVGMVSTAAFLLLGYGTAVFVRSRGRAAMGVGVTLLTLLFAYLRGYDLVRLALPESWVNDALVTAGLSFLFFKMLHVVVDARAGTLGELRLGTYLNYCLNFTTFLMGPIQRYQDFDRQWRGEQGSVEPGFENHLDAVNRILRGLVKKFVLAEYLWFKAIHAGMPVEAMGSTELLIGTYVFYLYLYCDFSGYCDVVIGVGSLMGVRPPENFNLPFFSRNVSDYWLRVHRTLTTWLTDYVFNPCFAGFLRRGSFRGSALIALCVALGVTMLVSGLWHGTTLSFVYFGLAHGLFLIVQRIYEQVMRRKLGRKRFRAFCANRVVHVLAVVLTYNLTSLAYLFFVFDAGDVWTVVRKVVAG